MVKLIGMILIASSLLSLIAGTFLGSIHGSPAQITGNAISNIINQPKVALGFFDYLEAIALSYSIISFIIGVVFLFRVR